MKNSNVISLRCTRGISFPHYVNFIPSTATTKTVNMGERYDKVQKKNVPDMKVITVMESGMIDIVCNPKEPIRVGDVVNPYFANYEITEIVEQRDAKGNWGFASVAPMWLRCKVKFLS